MSVEAEIFGQVAGRLWSLTDELMSELEGEDWAHERLGEEESVWFGQAENGQVVLEVGEASYVLGPAETIVETTRLKVRVIGREGVLRDADIVRPWLN